MSMFLNSLLIIDKNLKASGLGSTLRAPGLGRARGVEIKAGLDVRQALNS